MYNFLCRLMVFQSIIVFTCYQLFYSNTEKHALNFKDDIINIIAKSKNEQLEEIGANLGQNDFLPLYSGLLYTELTLAVLAIFKFNFLGMFNAVLIFCHGIIL